MSKDASSLARSLKSGSRASASQIADLKRRLQAEQPDEDAHNVLRAFALACPATEENIALVAKYLGDEADDYARQGAIYALGSYWRIAEQFRERLLELSAPSKWPDGSASSVAALGVLGEVLYESPNTGVLRTLLEWLEDEISRSDDQSRSVYIESLHRAIDVAMNGPGVSRFYIGRRFPRDVDRELMRRALASI